MPCHAEAIPAALPLSQPTLEKVLSDGSFKVRGNLRFRSFRGWRNFLLLRTRSKNEAK
jgi:hypothetical protein